MIPLLGLFVTLRQSPTAEAHRATLSGVGTARGAVQRCGVGRKGLTKT